MEPQQMQAGPSSEAQGPTSAARPPPSPSGARALRSLALATAAHFLFNFGNSGRKSIPGWVWPELEQQAGAGELVSSVLLVASAVGSLAGVTAAGAAMDRIPAHLVAFCVACGSGVNIALFPHKQGLMAVAISCAFVSFGTVVADCSYSALIWTATESGVARTGPYLVAKALGSKLGCLFAAAVAVSAENIDLLGGERGKSMGGGTSEDHSDLSEYSYSVLAYTVGALCLVGGVALVFVPSPQPPVVGSVPSPEQHVRRDSSGCSPAEVGRVGREQSMVFVGAVLLMMETALEAAAMASLTDAVPAEAAHGVLVFFYALSIAVLVASVALAQALPPAVALAILFSVAALGCAGLTMFFTVSGSCVALLWLSYGCLSAIVPTFPLTFSLIATTVDVSGKRSALLSCGAAMGPLAAAALATASPGRMWFGFTLLVAMSVIGVPALVEGGAAHSSSEQGEKHEVEVEVEVGGGVKPAW